MMKKILVVLVLLYYAAVNTFANERSIDPKNVREVNFKRDGLKLVGNLYTPANFNEKAMYKAVIVEGSFTSVKEQMPAFYAQRLADNGFVVLAFDYSHYGESEGNPRQLESPEEKLKDLKAAVTYLTGLPYIKGVGMVGVCTSAGNAVDLAANDTRIKAIATVAGFLPDPALGITMFGEKEVARRKALAEAAREDFAKTGKAQTIPAYSEVDQSAVNFAPKGIFDYYFNKARGGVPQYKNAAAVMSLDALLKFDPISEAHLIKVPTMVIHSDGSAFPQQAKKLYAKLEGEKELVWGDGIHFDYYDGPKQVDFAVKNITRYFNQYLN
ncbi:hypothetical protein SAMN05192573_11011 [Mucilaginibacter gossypii]|uniref:Xaa-Pro dipeptidyl-peptidase-like domain-containing protein n=2 Tax=Mucilaginibacter gossypii TaxID=551996 RepID=A0A1G8CQB6_9SPHI|nr:hypothetical protein SAMN05192573_11011 [Mucilaginibacter gossypii]